MQARCLNPLITAFLVVFLALGLEDLVLADCPDRDCCGSQFLCQWKSALDDPSRVEDFNIAFPKPGPGKVFPVWDGDAGSGFDQLKSPLAALGYYIRFRITGSEGDHRKAYRILGWGQFHNVQKKKGGSDSPPSDQDFETYYSDCLKEAGQEEDFWYNLLQYSDAQPDPDQLRKNIEWQLENNGWPMFWYAWVWCRQLHEPSKLFKMAAMYFLLIGERQHGSDPRDAQNLDRAAFATDPDAILHAVASINTEEFFNYDACEKISALGSDPGK